jgi:hypothetical protein
MKNYTSTVDPVKSIALMEAMLVRAGATNINKEYDGQKVKSLSFVIKHPDHQFPIAIRLPAKVQPVYEALRKQKHRAVTGLQNRLQEQAERTAWKLMYDWLAVQLTLIELRQVELLQVFLPFVWDGQQSFYERLKENRFTPLLPPPRPQDDDVIDVG